MVGYGYKPPAENSRVKDDKSEVERKLYEEKRSKITNNASDYARRLDYSRKYTEDSQSQLNPNFPTQYTEGSQSGYFDPNADYRAGSERYYKPLNYDVPYRTYDKSYYDIFNVASPEDIFTAKEIYYNVTNDPYYTEDEFTQNLLNTRKVDPIYLHADEDLAIASYVGLDLLEKGEFDLPAYYKFIEEYGYEDAQKEVTREERYEINTGEEYKEPQSFAEAKQMADKAYMDTLSHELKRAFYLNDEEATAQIKQAIEKGVPAFQNSEDTLYVLYGGSPITNAAKEQAYLMKDYLEANDIDLYKVADLKPESGASSTGVVDNKVWLNTGTALQHFETGTGAGASVSYKDVLETPTIGSYSFYETTPVFYEGKQEYKDAFAVFSDIVSTIYPPAAPIAKAANAVVQGGDLEDALKAGGKAYVTNKFAEVTNEEILKGFDDLGIDVKALPENVQNVIIDTSKATLQGDSGSDAFKKSATGELLDSVDIDINLPDTNLKTPQAIKNIGNAIVSGAESVGDVAEDILKPPLDFISETFEEGVGFVADTFEPAVDFLDEKLDALGESYVDPALQAAKEAGQSIIDPIDDALDTFGKEVVDPVLQAGSDVLSEGEDLLKEAGYAIDDIVDWESLLKGALGGLGGQQPQTVSRTPVEGLFDKELFKFDTEIKSTQEMLSPMMNSRRYG